MQLTKQQRYREQKCTIIWQNNTVRTQIQYNKHRMTYNTIK